MTALKAIPAIVEGIKELKASIIYLADNRTDKKIDSIKADIRTASEEFENAKTREEQLLAMRKLNDAYSE